MGKKDSKFLLLAGLAGLGYMFMTRPGGGSGGGLPALSAPANANRIRQLQARIAQEKAAIQSELNAKADFFRKKGIQSCAATLPGWQRFLGLGCNTRDNNAWAEKLAKQWMEAQYRQRVAPLEAELRRLGGISPGPAPQPYTPSVGGGFA